MKTAVIYARYSSERQTEQSIEGQLHVCSDYAKRNDLVIVGTYIDRAMTGTNDNREDFQRMLKDSDKKSFDYVLVYKLDRFSRNKYEMAIHRKHLKDNGVKILSAMENIPETPEGILLESLLEGMNQYYSEELSQKAKRGMRETRMKGKFTGGRVNYGYSCHEQKLSVIDEEAAVLLEIFTDYANGKSLTDIANGLNARGITNRGKPFLMNSIYFLLNNEKYTGVYRFGDKVFTETYPQIIPVDLYKTVKTKLDANRHGKHVTGIEYLLRGKVRCVYCGKNLRSHAGMSSSGIYRYYECPSPRKTTDCKFRAVTKEILEQLVVEAVTGAVNDKTNRELLIKTIMEIYKSRAEENTALRVLEKDLAQTSKALSNLLKAIESGIFTESTKQRLEELEAEKRALQEKILIEQSRKLYQLTEKDVEKYLLHGLKQKPKTMIDLLVEKVDVFREKLEITLRYTPQMPNDTPPKGKTEYSDADNGPDGNSPDRGHLFIQYTAHYTQTKKGRKSTRCWETISHKQIEILIFI